MAKLLCFALIVVAVLTTQINGKSYYTLPSARLSYFLLLSSPCCRLSVVVLNCARLQLSFAVSMEISVWTIRNDVMTTMIVMTVAMNSSVLMVSRL